LWSKRHDNPGPTNNSTDAQLILHLSASWNLKWEIPGSRLRTLALMNNFYKKLSNLTAISSTFMQLILSNKMRLKYYHFAQFKIYFWTHQRTKQKRTKNAKSTFYSRSCWTILLMSLGMRELLFYWTDADSEHPLYKTPFIKKTPLYKTFCRSLHFSIQIDPFIKKLLYIKTPLYLRSLGKNSLQFYPFIKKYFFLCLI
jgi:hypothetical protein